MSNIEFRNTGTYYFDHSQDEGQPTLPILVDEKREVHWVHEKRESRRRLLGSRVVTKLVIDEASGSLKTTFINAENITELNDPNLRYALRFADAANAVGWTKDSPWAQSAHHVSVSAIDNGIDSELISAIYTGITKGKKDTFMDNLLKAAPNSK